MFDVQAIKNLQAQQRGFEREALDKTQSMRVRHTCDTLVQEARW